MSSEEPIATLELRQEVEKVILPLIAVGEDAVWHPLGTAFVIAVFGERVALVMTASHCLRSLPKLDSPQRRAASVAPGFGPSEPETIDIHRIHLFVGVQSAERFVLAEVTKSWFGWNLDIGLSLAVLPPNSAVTFTSALVIDSRPPSVGTLLTAFGYPNMSADFVGAPDYEKQDFKVAFRKGLVWRRGTATAECPEGRGIHGWPGFLVDFAFDAGMSGGPLIEFRGTQVIVRGVVGGDISFSECAGVGSGVQAFASTLWPALGTAMELAVAMPGAPVPSPVSKLLDLVRLGVVRDIGASSSIVSAEVSDGLVTVRIAPREPGGP